MKTSCCAGFRMHTTSHSAARHLPKPSRPSSRRLSISASKSSSLNVSCSPFDTSTLLRDTVVWTEAPKCTSVEFLEQIGEGSYGAVYRGVDGVTGETVAVKKIPTRGNGQPGSSVLPFKIQLEAELHTTVGDCLSVVDFRGHVRMDGAECLVTELCDGGDLEQYTMRHGPLDEGQLTQVAREGTRMLRTCHQREILHGDIKAANFVIRSEDDAETLSHSPEKLQPGWLKGVDFGASMRMGKAKCSHKVGTPTHWAPEVFGAKFGLPADMWSFGTMLYGLAADRMPFFTREEEKAFRVQRELLLAIIKNEVDFEAEPWDAFGEDAKDFIARLLHREERKRMTPEEAARHPFLTVTETKRRRGGAGRRQ